MYLNSGAFGQGELPGLCRKHSPPTVALLLPRERALQNKADHFELITCAKTFSKLLGLRRNALLKAVCLFSANSWLEDLGLSPSTMNGTDEVSNLCPWFGVAGVIICHLLRGLGQNLCVSIAKG